MTRLTNARFAEQACYIAKTASDWAAGALTLSEILHEPMRLGDLKRFVEGISGKLTRLEDMAGSEPDDATGAAEMEWLVWSNEHGAWWRANSSGYTQKIERAGRYTTYQADTICRNGGLRRVGSKAEGPYEVAVLAPASATLTKEPSGS